MGDQAFFLEMRKKPFRKLLSKTHYSPRNETVNAEKYRETLSDFIPYANQLYPLGWVLEQDGATPHNLRNNLIDATYKRFTKCVENDGKLVTF